MSSSQDKDKVGRRREATNSYTSTSPPTTPSPRRRHVVKMMMDRIIDDQRESSSRDALMVRMRRQQEGEQQERQPQQRCRPQHLQGNSNSPPLHRPMQSQQRRQQTPQRGVLSDPLPLYTTPPRHDNMEPLLTNETANVDYSRRGYSPAPSMVATPHSSASSNGQQSQSRLHPASEMATPPTSNRKGIQSEESYKSYMSQLRQHQIFHSRPQDANVSSSSGTDQVPRYGRRMNTSSDYSHDKVDDDDCEHDIHHQGDDHSIDDGSLNHSLSIHSELTEEHRSEQDNMNLSLSTIGDWTLQSFLDHQLQASYLNGGSKVGGLAVDTPGRRGKRSRHTQQLSMASAYSNSPGNTASPPLLRNTTSRTGAEADGVRAAISVKARAKADTRGVDSARVGVCSSLATHHVSGEYIPKRRRMLPKLLVVCATLVALSCAFFVFSTSTGNMISNIESRQSDSPEGSDDWHPLFQHSHRTADVEMEVPRKTAKTESINIGGASQQEATGSMGGLGSSHRRQQDDVEESSTATDSQGTTFIEGDAVQELCPTQHTLISQSLILRSSYGNIFSITTPDDPNGTVKKRKRSVDPDVHTQSAHRGAEEPSDGGGHKSSPHRPASTGSKDEGVEVVEEGGEEGMFIRNRDLQNADPLSLGSGTGASYADSGNYNDIDTATESIYNGTGIETITIKTLSLRMSDFRPNDNTHFEVWLYTGIGDESDYERNENDLDNDPTNDNFPGMVPSKGEYQASRAKFSDWQLICEGFESELLPDTDFFDHNGHIFNIGTGTTIGPLGRLDGYENMEDVTLAAKEWNSNKLREDGGMNAITAEGEVTTTYFYKIPEEKFTPLKLPKYNGKLTLFVTLDRVGLQYGYAAKREFDKVDIGKHDYIDQTPSLDVLNGNVNMRMHVGEGVIFYPWMEEEFFYQTRRFLGKIWYDAKIPCEYVNYAELMEGGELTPSTAPSIAESDSPSLMPSMAPSRNGTNVTAAILISVLIKDEKEPMPDDVKEIFEKTVLEFVDDSFGDFCPLVWNEDATVTEQETSPIGGTPSGASSEERRKRDASGHIIANKRTPDEQHDGEHLFGRRYLRKLQEVLEPIFSTPPKPSRSRLLQAITVLDATTSIEALYSSPACPDKTPEEWASILENFINDNKGELLAKLKAAHDYFKDAFGVSADALDMPTEIRASEIMTEEEDSNAKWIILAALLALLLCCCCCLLPLLILRRRKRKESRENEIIGEDIEWARPVDQDGFPPMGGFRLDEDDASGVGLGADREDAKLRKRPDGEFPEEGEGPPALGLNPIPPGLRPPEDDTDMLHSTKWLDRPEPENESKQRPFGLPGRLPGEGEEVDPYNINIYPGGDYEDEEDPGDGINLRHVEKKELEEEDSDWEPDHYEPDGGVHGYEGSSKNVDINSSWNRLPKKGEKEPSIKKKLSIKELVLQRKKDLEAKMAAMRHVENLESGLSDDDSSQQFDKPEPDDRIEDLMTRIKDLEKDRSKKYERKREQLGESDYEIWRRLNIGDDELSSSSESSNEEVDLAAARRRKKKKKKKGDDYMLRFDDLDAYNRALGVHQDAYIHKWVKVKVEKDEDGNEIGGDGANLEDLEMEGGPPAQLTEEEYQKMMQEMAEGGAEVDGEGRPRFMGDMDLGDIQEGDEDGAGGYKRSIVPPGAAAAGGAVAAGAVASGMRDRRTQLAKQNTEYIGDFDVDDEDGGGAAAAAGERRSTTSRQKTEEDDEEEDLTTAGGRMRAAMRTRSSQAGDDAPASSFNRKSASSAAAGGMRDRRTQLAKQNTEYIGDFDVDDEEDGGAAAASGAGDRRSTMSRQKTEYIGSIRDMDQDDEPDLSTAGGRMRAAMKKKAQQANEASAAASSAPSKSALRSKAPTSAAAAAGEKKSAKMSSRQSAVRFGSIREVDDEEGGGSSSAAAAASAPAKAPTDRRSLMSREKTEYIGSIRGMDDEEGGASAAQAGGDRRSTMSRQQTEYIGSIRGIDEEEDDAPTDRRSLIGRQKTEYIGSIRDMDDDDDDNEQQPLVDRRSTLSREKTEYIGSIANIQEEEEEEEEDLSTPGGRMRAAMKKRRAG